jgi:hydroxymethylglutaryl-CoA synthase
MIAQAPGKLILSGEHAVVYGQPAIVTAVRRHVCSEFAESAQDYCFSLPDFDRELRLSTVDLDALHARLESQHAAFLRGEIPIGEVMPDPMELAPFAVACVHRRTAMPAAHITVRFKLPVGGGMGASAALAVAVLRGAWAWVGREPEALFEDAMACERLRHGNPSGVDPWASLHGGMLRFQAGQSTRLAAPIEDFFAVDTGTPASSTGECISHVRATADSAIWPRFGLVTDSLAQALAVGDGCGARKAVRENHSLLCEIGVVPPRVEEFVAALAATGGAAKVCGAGSVAGDAAGVVWILADSAPQALCDSFGYNLMTLERDDTGATIL